MSAADDHVDLRGRDLESLDLGGARVRNGNLAGLAIRDGILVGAQLSGLIDGLRVNGIEVAPLIWDEMVRRDPDLALTRSERLDDLRRAWAVVARRWEATVEEARSLGDGAEHARVDDEWSLVDTLRHLVFVTDGWINRTVHGAARPYHPLALPPSFLPDLSALGIDPGAAPDLDEILAVRAERQAVVSDLLDALTDEGLARTCAPNPAPGYPPDTAVSVLRCVHTVIGEEWAHHGYAERDLAALARERA